ncbi:MAG: chorismate--pyruvate lyase [Holdemanella sp.]|nr:chorismate--pyruvate lyase [Holdemanella sp.]
MKPIYYIVESIDGDYATLRNKETNETIVMAMSLLCEGISIHSELKYEMFEFKLIRR